MLAKFNFLDYDFVLSGDNERDLLWDLFDRIVYDINNQVLMMDEDPSLEEVEYSEIVDKRGSNEWIWRHTRYIYSNYSGYYSMEPPIPLDSESIFNLHKSRLYSEVIELMGSNEEYCSCMQVIYSYEHNVFSNEYIELISKLPTIDYPFNDSKIESFINYLVLKRILVFVYDKPDYIYNEETISKFEAGKRQDLLDAQTRIEELYQNSLKAQKISKRSKSL